MLFISYNLNGIRAALRKGLLPWVAATKADFIGFQELKAHIKDFDPKSFNEMGYNTYWNPAEQKGYSGIGILTKQTPSNVHYGLNHPQLDKEGRVITLSFHDFHLINAYFPSGASHPKRQELKIQFLSALKEHINSLEHQNVILMGDFNIAHKPQDIYNPNNYNESPGFTQAERQWMDELLQNFNDAFRTYNNQPDNYTWWPHKKQSRLRNLGWRIDYILYRGNKFSNLIRSNHLTAALHSDHCPVLAQFAKP